MRWRKRTLARPALHARWQPRTRSSSCGAACWRPPSGCALLEERLLETKGQLAQAVVPEREADLHPPAGQASTSPRCATRSTSSPSRRPPTAPSSQTQRRRHRRRLLRRAARCGSRSTPTSTPTSSAGAARSCSTSPSTSCWPAALERPGEVVTIKEVLDDGTRALVVGRGRRGAGRRAGRRPARRSSSAPATRVLHRRPHRPAAREAAAPGGRGARARGGARHHLRRHRRPRRPDRGDHRRGRAAVPAPGAVRRAPAAGAEGHPALRPARAAARPSSPRRSPTRWPRRSPSVTGDAERPQLLPQHQGPRAAQQVRGRDRAPDPPRVPAGPGEGGGGRAGHRLLRRDGLAVPHARHGHQLRHGVDDRAAAAGRDRRRRDAAERHRDRRLQPRGPDRPGHPAARAAST